MRGVCKETISLSHLLYLEAQTENDAVTLLFIVPPLATEVDIEKANVSFKTLGLESICNLKELLLPCW